MAKKQLRPASAAEQFIKTAEGKQRTTAEELEAQGQTRLIEPKRETETEQKKTMGQPKKYDEPTKHVSFSLPLSVIEDLKILAGLRKTNQTQIILNLIKSELKKEKKRLEAYKSLME